MSVAHFIQYATDALFSLIFLVVVVGAFRRPRRVQLQATLFFGTAFYLLTESLILNHFAKSPPAAVQAVNQLVLISMSYLLLRLVNSLSDVPAAVFRIGEIGLALLGVQALVGIGDRRIWFILPAIIYFLAFTIYATVIAVNASREVEGVTKQRLRAVAAGSSFLAVIIVIAGISAIAPSTAGSNTHVTTEMLALMCGFSYFIAFATPVTLRRAWLEPVMREFFAGAVSLPQHPVKREMLIRLEESARDSLGGIAASLALWDETKREFDFPTGSIGVQRGEPQELVEGATLLSRRTTFCSNLPRDYPQTARVYSDLNAKSVVSAPVNARGQRFGVLSVYLKGSPLFIEDDLTLLSLMADHAGVILESRARAEEEARLRSREEALKLRNDFLASIAHDLKTPLTALVMQAQLLERRARRSPGAPADVEGLHQIIVQTHRLRTFIEDLLDVQKSDDQGLVLNCEPCEVVPLVREIGERVCVNPHRFVLDADPDAIVFGDRALLTQLFDNLIGNAVKYSPEGGEIHVRIWCAEDGVHATVSDQGIGIRDEDLPHIFERHHRGENAKDQGVHGIGLGLFICRAIVQAHDGTLQVESTSGQGSTFHVVIPREPSARTEPRIGPWLLSTDNPPEITGDLAS